MVGNVRCVDCRRDSGYQRQRKISKKKKRRRRGKRHPSKAAAHAKGAKHVFKAPLDFSRLCGFVAVGLFGVITSRQPATRNGFNRKMADFVLCSKAFDVLAVIELDDSSHKNREREDADRYEWLTKAGYRVVRYPQIPEEAKLLADFLSVLRTQPVLPWVSADRV